MKDELVKDLEGFDCDVCPNNERLNSRGVKECWEWDGGACVEYALQWVADRLSDLGYVKVVRCGECRHLEERTIAGFDKEHPCKTMYICKSPHSHMIAISRCNKDYYCSEGEAKEGANA